jgi:hypothetical protein
MNVYYDSPSAKTLRQNNSGDFTSHAHGCVYKAATKTWHIQEPLGEPIRLDSTGMKEIRPFFEHAIRCEFYAFTVLPLIDADKLKLKKRLKKTDEKSFLSDDESDSSSSGCTGAISEKSRPELDLPPRSSQRILAQALKLNAPAPKPNAPNRKD